MARRSKKGRVTLDSELLAKTDRELLLLLHQRIGGMEDVLEGHSGCHDNIAALWRSLRWTQIVIGMGAVVGLAQVVGFEALAKIASMLRVAIH